MAASILAMRALGEVGRAGGWRRRRTIRWAGQAGRVRPSLAEGVRVRSLLGSLGTGFPDFESNLAVMGRSKNLDKTCTCMRKTILQFEEKYICVI